MDNIKRKRVLLKSASTIKKYLALKGYSMDRLSNKNAIALFARTDYNEDIEKFSSKEYCEEWLLLKIEKGDINKLFTCKKKKHKIKTENKKEITKIN